MLTRPLGVVDGVPGRHEADPDPVEVDRAAEVGVADVWPPSLRDLAGELDDRDDRRAGALGDRDGVAEVVAVAVREEDRVGGDVVGAGGRLRVAGQERVDEHVLPSCSRAEGGVAQEADVHAGLQSSLFVVISSGQLQPDGDADEHAQARLLGQQRAHGAAGARSGRRGGRPGDLLLVGRAEPVRPLAAPG